MELVWPSAMSSSVGQNTPRASNCHCCAAGLLHDTVEDTNDAPSDEIGNWFGSAVRRIVTSETQVLQHVCDAVNAVLQGCCMIQLRTPMTSHLRK